MIETIANWLETIPVDCALWIVVIIFIALDVIAGTTKAFLTKTVSSEKARKGIMHKMGYVLAMLMCTNLFPWKIFIQFLSKMLFAVCIFNYRRKIT